MPGLRLAHQQFLDECLRCTGTTAALADVHHTRLRTQREHLAAGQIVNQHHIGGSQQTRGLERQKLNVARPGADEKDFAGLTRQERFVHALLRALPVPASRSMPAARAAPR